MIYTVTFNPAIDYVIKVDDLTLGKVNRTKREDVYCGGKGINVSNVLSNLGIDSVGLGFIAGFTGDAIEAGAKKLGFQPDFIRLREGMTRINVKIKSNEESEINGQGPVIHDDELEQMFQKIDQLKDGDMLVLAGSIPASLPEDIYERIMERLQGRDIQIVVDATKDLLLNVLKYHPFMIKPNNHELGEMFGIELKDNDEIIEHAKKLQEKGARNVLVSMAGDGAILVTEDGDVHMGPCPKGEVKNSVGAGDSMVAGFITGYLKSNGNYEEALKMGTAAGSASAFSEDLATGEKIMELYKQL
ncbi:MULTISPECIES: 1-phosphofructokinase [Anaerostipes]|uniref:Tagatose-6-phosphate kinase n=1 Tax=Anaerostipes butyraticus TaxID=645466 RepID=A0A916Q6Q6_9FIRM|nr:MULTISPECIES: 1-phosphofructokinase [Anaerostipes]GFO83675.1 tagatose-6-phosphate kinase [Anaerostipes butyraticus]HJC82894.1 1-phosphofructokinase [Candidatus Anaerostipes avicola]